jgi:2,3-bisphosphoglycerate-independent phosphoglycerate mutase
MKTVIILGDGMSDEPVEALGDRTPLQVAKKPHIDRIAREGRVGLFQTIRPGQPKGSAVANMAVLGYDPAEVYQGGAVLEAASRGVEVAADAVALRCNLICIEDGKIKNHSAGHISSDEAAELVQALDVALGNLQGEQPVKFHPGVSYRHLLLLEGGWASAAVKCAPPHDHVGEPAEGLMWTASDGSAEAEATAARLVELYRKALPILADHPVNKARLDAGKDPGNSLWTWSPGRRPEMKTFQERFDVSGAVISAVDLVMGLGKYAGFEIIHVEGATGLEDTNYEGKAAACLEALEKHDMVYVHVEATDEAGHSRDVDLKVKCIEYLDQRLVRLVLAGIAERGIEARVAVLPDHATPVKDGKHADFPVPVAVMGSGLEPDPIKGYDEHQAARGSLGMLEGDQFIGLALGVSD